MVDFFFDFFLGPPVPGIIVDPGTAVAKGIDKYGLPITRYLNATVLTSNRDDPPFSSVARVLQDVLGDVVGAAALGVESLQPDVPEAGEPATRHRDGLLSVVAPRVPLEKRVDVS